MPLECRKKKLKVGGTHSRQIFASLTQENERVRLDPRLSLRLTRVSSTFTFLPPLPCRVWHSIQ